MPELMATAGSMPWRWKKRTRAAVTAPDTVSTVNVLESSSITSGKNGSGSVTVPSTDTAEPTKVSALTTAATTTQPTCAWAMTDADFDALSRVTISAQPPMAVPAARTMLPQLNRLSSSSLGTSTDVAAAAVAARSFSRCRSFALRIDACRRGGSEALCSRGRAATTTSTPRTSTATSTAC